MVEHFSVLPPEFRVVPCDLGRQFGTDRVKVELAPSGVNLRLGEVLACRKIDVPHLVQRCLLPPHPAHYHAGEWQAPRFHKKLSKFAGLRAPCIREIVVIVAKPGLTVPEKIYGAQTV
jgi:hypothetical protein